MAGASMRRQSPRRRQAEPPTANKTQQTAFKDAEPKAPTYAALVLAHSASIPTVRILAAASALRIALLCFGAWQDANLAVKYTDVDYNVLTDAARYVSLGESPFLRATFRYTPLLAWILVPNTWTAWTFVWGKLVFIACDIAVGAMLMELLSSGRSSETELRGKTVLAVAGCWLFNPIVMNVSTRGNAESLIALFVVATLYCLYRRQWLASGICLGVAIHLKIYPIIYAPAMVLWILRDQNYLSALGQNMKSRHGTAIEGSMLDEVIAFMRAAVFGLLSSMAALKFLAGVIVSFLVATGSMYVIYGEEFLHHAYFYHVTRTDNRHNFSLYFYSLYLGAAGVGTTLTATAKLMSLAAFVPQVTLLGLSTLLLFSDLGLCMFIQTMLFVAFNKVCTVQYFVWYIVLLPLALRSAPRVASASIGLPLLFGWFGFQLLWLSQAYALEFLGENAFLRVWIAGVLFFSSNIVTVVVFLRNRIPNACFKGSR